jgi:GABA permease
MTVAAGHQLSKDLQSRHVAMISIGGIIGAGLFIGSSSGIATVGPAIVISYLLAGAVVMLVMRMLGEMAAASPETGSFTEFARLGLGNWAGFTAGWLYWFFWVVTVSIEAQAGALLLQKWTNLPLAALELGLLALMMATNLWSTRSFGEFEFWFASIKVTAVIAFILVIGAYVFGFMPSQGGRFANLTTGGGFAPHGPLSILGGVSAVIFALVGAEIATIAAAESREPGRAIARMTGQLVVRILLFYVLSIFLIVVAVPWTSIHPGDSPFAMALERLKIPGVALIMNVIVLTAVLSVLNSGLYVTSRVLFTLAARGDAPQALVVLNSRKVPARALLVATSFGVVATAASVLSPKVVFAFLIAGSGALMLLIYLLIAFAQIRLRRRRDADGSRLDLRMWFFPWGSYLTVAAIIGILAAMAFTPALASQLIASLGVFALVLGLYFGVRRGLKRPALSPRG